MDYFLGERPHWGAFKASTSILIRDVWAYQQGFYQLDPKDEIKAIIISTAEEQNINPDLFLKVAICESGLNPNAKNPNSTASGLFQFLKTTWDRTIKEMGKLTYDVFNPYHNAEAAAYLINKDGLARHWKESRNCWINF
ncbi:MAG: transglycosylase SLT domain-containing protein [Nanoarchaeota archaeon]